MNVVGFYFSPFGRVSLRDFWLRFILPYFILSAILMIALSFFVSSAANNDPRIGAGFASEILLLFAPVALVVFWISIALLFKRLHDRNLSGWWFFLPFLILTATHAVYSVLPPSFGMYYLGGSEIPIVLAGGLAVAFIIDLWLFVNIYFLSGTRGANRFGEDPRSVQ